MKSLTLDAPTRDAETGSLRKLNCWEYKRCGRQPQGPRVKDMGLCPASTEESLDGAHDGVNAGRACWVVGGTFCQGEVQGTFGQKFKNCEACDFYQLVRNEERFHFTLSAVLLAKVRNKAG
jgi:hypothetical protein